MAGEPLAAILDKLARKELSAAVLVEACLERVSRLDGRLHAFITVAAEQARSAARAFDAADLAGRGMPLGGIPYALKDMFHTRALPTTAGSRVLERWTPDSDAAVVERLAGAGAILIGKNTQHEFAYGITGHNDRFGTAANPWNPERLAGGSSGGSAAAVAAGMAVFALGTDTAGSVRVPAALCGIVGLKPTFGLVSRYGMIPYSWSLDHVGILARSVGDAAAVLQVIAGHDARDTGSRPIGPGADYADLSGGIRGLSVGVPRAFCFSDIDPEAGAAAERALSTLPNHGATVVDIDLADLDLARTVSLTIQLPEALTYHRPMLRRHGERYGSDVRGGLATGQFVLAEHYVQALRMAERYRRAVDEILRDVDVLVTPTTPAPAPAIGSESLDTGGGAEPTGDALTRFTALFAVTGHPALTVPAGLDRNGLPLGVQVVGRAFDEATLFRVGAALEADLGPLVLPGGIAGGPGASGSSLGQAGETESHDRPAPGRPPNPGQP